METSKLRIAVLMGGASHEKEISLESGRNVFYKLSPYKYNALPLFVTDTLELYQLTQAQLVRNSTLEVKELLQETQKIKWSDLPSKVDFVFNALHGGHGENGSVQGALEMLGLPYNGSSVFTSALCMNKYKTNQLLAINGFDVPKNVYITKEEWMLCKETFFDTFCFTKAAQNVSKDELSYPLIVKPYDDGCSVMVQEVTNDEDFVAAVEKILKEKDAVLIEECITGMELTVGVIGNNIVKALPPSRAVSAAGILSIEEKFLPGAGENQTPAPLPKQALQFVQTAIEKVYITMQCKGYARIDCFYQNELESPTGKERIVILEINTLPGLTPATCLFHQAAEIGLTPMEFIDKIIMLGFEEYAPEKTQGTIYHSIQNDESETDFKHF